mmetsp:Transcript_61630/g.190911  ORF Transcript_61630/g.190911 Transcript_61630/m.190911 type:complete len:156 (-) Transcript_61630:262-729(-)
MDLHLLKESSSEQKRTKFAVNPGSWSHLPKPALTNFIPCRVTSDTLRTRVFIVGGCEPLASNIPPGECGIDPEGFGAGPRGCGLGPGGIGLGPRGLGVGAGVGRGEGGVVVGPGVLGVGAGVGRGNGGVVVAGLPVVPAVHDTSVLARQRSAVPL